MIITAIAGMLTGQIHAPSGVIGDIPSIKPTFGAAFESFKDQDNYLRYNF